MSHKTCHNPPTPRHWFHAQRNPIYHNYMDVCLYWSHVSQARLTLSSKIKIDVWVPGMSLGTSTSLWLSSSCIYKPLSVILIDLFPPLSLSHTHLLSCSHILIHWCFWPVMKYRCMLHRRSQKKKSILLLHWYIYLQHLFGFPEFVLTNLLLGRP